MLNFPAAYYEEWWQFCYTPWGIINFRTSTAFAQYFLIDIFVTEFPVVAANTSAAAVFVKVRRLVSPSMSARKVRVQCALCAKHFFVFLESIT